MAAATPKEQATQFYKQRVSGYDVAVNGVTTHVTGLVDYKNSIKAHSKLLEKARKHLDQFERQEKKREEGKKKDEAKKYLSINGTGEERPDSNGLPTNLVLTAGVLHQGHNTLHQEIDNYHDTWVSTVRGMKDVLKNARTDARGGAGRNVLGVFAAPDLARLAGQVYTTEKGKQYTWPNPQYAANWLDFASQALGFNLLPTVEQDGVQYSHTQVLGSSIHAYTKTLTVAGAGYGTLQREGNGKAFIPDQQMFDLLSDDVTNGLGFPSYLIFEAKSPLTGKKIFAYIPAKDAPTGVTAGSVLTYKEPGVKEERKVEGAAFVNARALGTLEDGSVQPVWRNEDIMKVINRLMKSSTEYARITNKAPLSPEAKAQLSEPVKAILKQIRSLSGQMKEQQKEVDKADSVAQRQQKSREMGAIPRAGRAKAAGDARKSTVTAAELSVFGNNDHIMSVRQALRDKKNKK
jgi:hypothetical protein